MAVLPRLGLDTKSQSTRDNNVAAGFILIAKSFFRLADMAL
jgi:hypothetical protein